MTTTRSAATQTQQKSVIATIYPLAFINTLAALATSMVNVLLPLISREAGTDVAVTQWATLGFLLTSAVLIVPAGWLGDRIGKAKLLRWSLIVFLAASILGTFAPNFATLVIARALQGIGVAAMLTTPLALVRNMVEPNRTGQAMGIMGSSMAAGMAAGPALGGLISATVLGWRGAFSLFILLTIVGLVMVSRHVPIVTPDRAGSGLDSVGLILLALGLIGYSVALTIKPWGLTGTIVLLVLSVIALVFFVWRQFKTTAPLIDLGKLQAAGLIPQLILSFGAGMIMMTFTIIPPFYLTEGLGLTEMAMGLVMAIGPVMAIIAGVPAGRFVDRVGANRMVVLGLGTMTVAAVGFTTFPLLLPLVGFIMAAVILTPGNQMFMAGNNTQVMSQAPAHMQGAVSGALNLMRNLGFTTGTALMAAVYDLAHSVSSSAQAGLQASFGLAAGIGVVMVIIAWRSGKSQR